MHPFGIVFQELSVFWYNTPHEPYEQSNIRSLQEIDMHASLSDIIADVTANSIEAGAKRIRLSVL